MKMKEVGDGCIFSDYVKNGNHSPQIECHQVFSYLVSSRLLVPWCFLRLHKASHISPLDLPGTPIPRSHTMRGMIPSHETRGARKLTESNRSALLTLETSQK